MGVVGIDALQNRIEQVIQIHRDAGDVTRGEIVGVLEIIKLDIYAEVYEDDDE